MKRFLCAACAVLFAVALVGCGDKEDGYPAATEQFFVNDFADVISDEDEATIYTKGAALDDATTAQAVVVTVDSLDGEVISDYALNLGREWGIGTKEDDNGVLILLSVDDREVYIAVGYGLEGALPDSKTGRLLDNYAIDHFATNDFSAGLSAVYDAVVNEIYIEYDMQPADGYTPINQIPEATENDGYALRVGLSWLILVVIVALYFGIFGRRHRFVYFGGPPFGGFHGGFGGSGFTRGGFGGGSGFRGGGGSFGGGGAGRKF